jgi:hypothetical protein
VKKGREPEGRERRHAYVQPFRKLDGAAGVHVDGHAEAPGVFHIVPGVGKVQRREAYSEVRVKVRAGAIHQFVHKIVEKTVERVSPRQKIAGGDEVA